MYNCRIIYISEEGKKWKKEKYKIHLQSSREEEKKWQFLVVYFVLTNLLQVIFVIKYKVYRMKFTSKTLFLTKKKIPFGFSYPKLDTRDFLLDQLMSSFFCYFT